MTFNSGCEASVLREAGANLFHKTCNASRHQELQEERELAAAAVVAAATEQLAAAQAERTAMFDQIKNRVRYKRGTAPHRQDLIADIFHALDRNGNGKLSRCVSTTISSSILRGILKHCCANRL